MKNLFATATIVGAAIAAIIVYLLEDAPGEGSTIANGNKGVGKAAAKAYNTMNKHLGKVEKRTEKAMDNAGESF